MIMSTGPKFNLTADCGNCEHLKSEKYVCQSDWGFDYTCGLENKYIGDSKTVTPKWCPFYKQSLKEFLNRIQTENEQTNQI